MLTDLLSVTAIGVQTLTGLIFLLAALAKLADRGRFAGIVANFRLLPPTLTAPVALVLPWLELALALLLPLRVAGPVPALAAALLLILFAVAMGVNIRRGRRFIDCGCGDRAAGTPLGWGRVLRNLGLAGLLLLAAIVPAPPTAWVSVLMGWGLGLVLFLLDRLFWTFTDLMKSGPRRPLPRG